MNANQKRVELRIDVFDQAEQKALALIDLKPPRLIQAILQEFQALEYLGDEADDYILVEQAGGQALNADKALSEQVKDGAHLALLEREAPLPDGCARPSQPIYLRDPHQEKTYAIHWLPAIIGRRSAHQPNDAWVAVDLQAYASGQRVSRRHVLLTEVDGRFYVENLSSTNSVSLIPAQQTGSPRAITAERQPLASGDSIRLDRSGIELKCIVRQVPAQLMTEEPAQEEQEEQ